MMSNNKKKSEKGFTFLELIVCFGILLIVVVPVCFQFMQGLNQRFTVNSITQATAYGEKMLEDVKAQITRDIKLRNEILGNKKKESDPKEKVGVSKYLEGSRAEPSRVITEFLQSRDENSVNDSYNTDKFTYEVALWRMEDLNLASTRNKFTLDDTVFAKSARFYTDINYPFEESDYTSMINPITFEVTDTDIYDSANLANHIIDKNYIEFPLTDSASTGRVADNINDKNDVIITNTNGRIIITCNSVIKSIEPAQAGFIFNIIGNAPNASERHKTGVIEVDLRNLQRVIDAAGTGYIYEDVYRKITLKFINNTDANQVIRLKQNVVDTESTEKNNDIYNIDIEDLGTGKTSIIRSDDNEYYDDYLIGIIIREKSPVQGQPGKIVKKMVDVYNYDTMNN